VAAICCYLADEFPKAGLNVPVGRAGRGPYLKWLFYGPGVLEPAIMDRAFPRTGSPPRTALGYGDFDTAMNVTAGAIAPGPYLMGDKLTAADLVIGSNLRWSMLFKLIPERKEFSDYVARLSERPAFKRATVKDEEFAKA